MTLPRRDKHSKSRQVFVSRVMAQILGGDHVPVSEDAIEFVPHEPVAEPLHRSHRRKQLVVDSIGQNARVLAGLGEEMPVIPRTKRAADLHITEHLCGLVFPVLGDPPSMHQWGKPNLDLDPRTRPNAVAHRDPRTGSQGGASRSNAPGRSCHANAAAVERAAEPVARKWTCAGA